MDIQVVYEKEEHGPYGYTRVGLRIDDRVVWLALYHDQKSYEDFAKWDRIAHEIAAAWEAKKGEE